MSRTPDAGRRAFLAVVRPQTSVKCVRGHVTSVGHALSMSFDDPRMDDDLRAAVDAHEIALDGEWAEVE
jgi:hypothetical protein